MTIASAPISDCVPEMDAAELATLGITLVRTDHYHVGPYRYGKLAGPIAKTRRRRVPENGA